VRIGPIALLLVAGLVAAGPGVGQELERADFAETVTTAGRINLTVANYGKTGNDFRSRAQASFEFPSGSEHEHMVRGGIWIGGQVVSGGLQTYVTTGVNDGSEGAAVGEGAEFVPRRLTTWPLGTNILRRSRQSSSQFYSADAIADEELIAYFDDVMAIPGGTDPHTPLRIKVKQTALVWGFAPFENIVFLNYEVTNTDPLRTITDLYVGAYAELATGDKGASDDWPPGGQWYGAKDVEWLDSLRVIREHRPPGGGLDADTYCGLQFLGTDEDITSQTTTFTWWEWRDETPRNDEERYEVLSRGTDTPTAGSEAGNADPVTFIGVGPFPVLAANEADTLRFSIAYLGGEDAGEVEDHARIAIAAYEAGFDIPVPPPVPNFLVEPGPNEIVLRWDDLPERTPDPQSDEIDFEGYRIYLARRPDAPQFEWLKEVDIIDDYQFPEDQTQEDIRFNTGLGSVIADDPITVTTADGETITYRYKYTIRDLRDGFKYWVAITAFDRGTQDLPPLESGINLSRTLAIPGTSPVAIREGSSRVGVFPNPYRGAAVWDGSLARDRYLWFTNLPSRATIRIYTLAGDLVDEFEFDGDTYAADDVRGIYDPTDPTSPDRDLPILSGGMAAWDLITRNDQAVASGLYLFSVEDRDTGERQVGRFLILK